MSLASLFPDEDYRFQMRFERDEARNFFAPTAEHDALITERRRWLQSAPETYASLLSEGSSLLNEAAKLAQTWQGFNSHASSSTLETCRALGEFWEVDYLLLKRAADGEIRLYGGCLCFPSSWRLSDKIGKRIEFIHGPVPGLNESIGPAIHKFLAGLKPGVAWLRHNWGLACDSKLNHHPDRNLPRLKANIPEEEVFLRVEHQALVALPASDGILFGIRVVNHPLAEVKADAVARGRLHRALETMPEAMARYKGIADARTTILQMLAS